MLMLTAWVKADWNATTSRWDIDCSKIDSFANMPLPGYNAANQPANRLPRKGSHTNANTMNPNPYNAPTTGPKCQRRQQNRKTSTPSSV